MPDISCVICAYMEAPRIGAVLSAVAGHPLLKEIIVVDDGSTDATAAVVSCFPSITLLRQAGNQGKSRALAAGVRAGSGELILYLDADLKHLTPADISALAEPVLSGPVTAHGGEVLKFMGDGVLAMFPFEVGTEAGAVAAQEALAAAQEALERLAVHNLSRNRAGETPIRCGIALHTGDAMYGNVGSARRLDFTVMGPAINEVCRLETLCKALSVPFVMSARVASLLRQEQLQSLGWHKLHGIGRDIEVFSLPALG